MEEGDGEEVGVAREVGVGGGDGDVVEVGGGTDGHVDWAGGDAIGAAGVVELGGEDEGVDSDWQFFDKKESLSDMFKRLGYGDASKDFLTDGADEGCFTPL